MVLRNNGNWFEVARFAAGGNVGFGTTTPAYKLDVAGPIRSSSGDSPFLMARSRPLRAAAVAAAHNGSTNGTSLYYNGGNVGIGTITPGLALDVSQDKAIRVGNAILSSGGDYVHLGNHSWFGANTWQFDGLPGALYQIQGQNHAWYTHNVRFYSDLIKDKVVVLNFFYANCNYVCARQGKVFRSCSRCW
jgi:hypothetical protein